jgi:hypothetical protein
MKRPSKSGQLPRVRTNLRAPPMNGRSGKMFVELTSETITKGKSATQEKQSY